MRKYISPHYLLSGLLGMLALVLSVSCDDTDVVRRVDPQIEVQADLLRVLPLHGKYCRFILLIHGLQKRLLLGLSCNVIVDRLCCRTPLLRK